MSCLVLGSIVHNVDRTRNYYFLPQAMSSWHSTLKHITFKTVTLWFLAVHACNLLILACVVSGGSLLHLDGHGFSMYLALMCPFFIAILPPFYCPIGNTKQLGMKWTLGQHTFGSAILWLKFQHTDLTNSQNSVVTKDITFPPGLIKILYLCHFAVRN